MHDGQYLFFVLFLWVKIKKYRSLSIIREEDCLKVTYDLWLNI